MKILKYLCYLTLQSFLIFTFSILHAEGKENYSYSSNNPFDIVIKEEEINSFIIELYSGYDVIEIKKDIKNSTINNAKDYSQSSLNKFYNKNFLEQGEETIYNTCTIAATLSILEYHSRVKNSFDLGDENEAFAKIFKETKKNKYIKEKSGTNPNKHGHILYDAYNIFSKKDRYNISNHGYDIRRLIRDDITKHDGVIMFTIPKHTVVGKGVVNYIVKYKNKHGKTWTENVEFFAINEGWWPDKETFIYSKKITNWWNNNFATTMRIKK